MSAENAPTPFDVREGALRIAREFVLKVYPERDDPRHPHTVTEMREILSQMLTIAEFLSGEPMENEATTLAQILTAVQSIDSRMP